MSALLRRLVAFVALLAFAGTLALPLVTPSHLAWNDDADFGPNELGPRHSTTAFRQAADRIPSGHCALCHWLRAFAGADFTRVQSSTPPLDARALDASFLPWWHGRLASLDRPSRAPPSLLSL